MGLHTKLALLVWIPIIVMIGAAIALAIVGINEDDDK